MCFDSLQVCFLYYYVVSLYAWFVYLLIVRRY